MTEIKIEEKAPKWPWILLIIAIIAILVYIFAFGDDETTDDREEDRIEQTTEDSAERRQGAANNSAVTAYVNFIQEDPHGMGLDHDFTNEALMKLTNATHAMADQIGYDVRKDIEKAKSLGNKVASDPFETSHANSIRKAGGILAQVLQNIQQKAFPNMASEANEVKEAIAAIELDVQTLEQKEAIKNFFRESADLLEKMNTNSPQK